MIIIDCQIPTQHLPLLIVFRINLIPLVNIFILILIFRFNLTLLELITAEDRNLIAH